MNNIFKILSVFVFCVALAACTKNSNNDPAPLRDYGTQYAADIAQIDQYIDSHYLTFDADYNVAFDTLLPGGGHSSIRTDTAFHLSDTTVAQNGINYKIYFIKFREGDLVYGNRPTQVDSIHVAYRGTNLIKSSQFDVAVTPVWFKLDGVVTGWSHIIPNFHTGTYSAATGPNPATFNNFGAGVMFLPSGLAYYNNAASNIAAYSPIVFSFKLYELHYRDHDGDGILDKDERRLPASIPKELRWKENPATGYDFDGDGIVDLYDTDGDGIANMYDVDDDGDNVLTRTETIKLPADITTASPLGHYPFSPTPTEPKGVPDCSNDYTTSTRLRKYLDPTCH